MVAAHDGRPEYLGAVGEELWWTAPRPAEAGRRALLRLRPGAEKPESVLPPPWNVRSRVLEYGGLPWAGIARDAGGPLVVFVDFADQRLYAVEPDAPGGPRPRPLTPDAGGPDRLRWCDPVIRAEAGEVWCVLEELGAGHPADPEDVRRLPVAVPLDGGAAGDRAAVRALDGPRHRFVTGPRPSPDGRRAVWLAWDHPRMPWDGTEVKIAEVAPGPEPVFTDVRTLAGGPDESVAQAEWAPDGSLLVASDRTGWWNVHRVDPGTGHAVNLCPRPEEFADALWRVGSRWFAPLDDGTIAVTHGRGSARLGVLDPATGHLADAPGPWTEWQPCLAVRGTRVTGIAAGPDRGHEIVRLDTATGHCQAVAAHYRDPVDPAYHAPPLRRVFEGPGGREVHALIHAPHHPEVTGPEGAAPPFVIWAHGGPTSRWSEALDLEVSFFTSRGIGVARVDYGGSTGYGRAYRDRLRERWGVVDVEDCAAVARALAAEGSADPAALAIRGGSAGGWTAAASLADPATSGLYACAAISYPVLDLAAWGPGTTHDFESRYPETLIGPRDAVGDRYRERSPVHRAHGITAPFLLLQGLDDPICPPAQAEALVAAVAGRDVPHTYLTFPGEGHGFRRADTVRTALEAELALYLATFPGTAARARDRGH
ncbi:prolyl oligopeptidase family serine peptidase [Streptomyces marincola]|uniref:prolyl oligopeptidase family serine peptidase n=1 Tax=Streptomyces marincola TaxID=2878388 RepID=UPI001CF4CE92|nr:prolyl oligopeptidase family serine peptidase [Streptomyces marincola]UCM91980.1 prolyl oligopeptidase family serine peptidase [Streptomyces marincola]